MGADEGRFYILSYKKQTLFWIIVACKPYTIIIEACISLYEF